MMAQERGNVCLRSVLGLALICLSLIVHSDVAESAEFNVGDQGGWTYDVNAWPNGKSFAAGDVFVFKYNQGQHNVVVVDAAGYNSCEASPDSEVLETGNDRITLNKGDNYFLCSTTNHCELGMKIAVHAT